MGGRILETLMLCCEGKAETVHNDIKFVGKNTAHYG